mgnify:CR=1 FL=1
MGNVYSNSKMFHYHDKLDDIQAGRLSAPIHVRLKPTNFCTHRCYYCCYRNDELYLSERMNEREKIGREKMQELISDLGQMGVKAVTLTGGGEPLCYRYIVETIQGLLDAGIKVAMLTHGGLLKGEVAELLARRAVWVRISMDAADRQTYAKNRGVALEEFDRVCENIRNFADVEGRKCVLGLNLIVAKDNSADVLDFFRMAKELDIKKNLLVINKVTDVSDVLSLYKRVFNDESVQYHIVRLDKQLYDLEVKGLGVDKFKPDSIIFQDVTGLFKTISYLQKLKV